MKIPIIEALPTEKAPETASFRGQQILKAPQPAITAASGTPSTGGTDTNTVADAAVINNIIIRVGELETLLKNLGLMKRI